MFPIRPSSNATPLPVRARRDRNRLLAHAVWPVIAACSSSPAATTTDAGSHSSSSSGSPRTDAGDAHASASDAGARRDAGAVQRGPLSIATPSTDPNGVFWDASTSTLYIADNENDRVMTWTDAGGLKALVSLPGPTGNEVGGIVMLTNGTLVVPEFGFGTSGLVALVAPNGTASSVPGLDMTKRRLGIAVAPNGTLYDTYFNKVNGTATGFVATLDVTAGTETDVITGLQKPVGVVVVGTTLYLSDQTAGEVYAAPLATPQSYKALATNLSPDLLSAGPPGTIFSGSPTGVVYQIDTTTGTFNTLLTAGGTLEPRGTAYDAANKRLFVAEHDSADVAHYIEIVPVSG